MLDMSGAAYCPREVLDQYMEVRGLQEPGLVQIDKSGRTSAKLAGLAKEERSTISAQGFLCMPEAERQVLEQPGKRASDDNWRGLAESSKRRCLPLLWVVSPHLSEHSPQHISEAVEKGLQLPLLLLHSCRLRWRRCHSGPGVSEHAE